MNKFINVLLLFLLFPLMLFTIWVGFDLPVEFFRTSGSQIPYKEYVFLTFGTLFLILNLRRSVRRWMGMRLVNQIEKFKWNAPMSKQRVKRVAVYTILEGLIFAFAGTVLFNLTSNAWLPAVAMWLVLADNIVLLFVGTTGDRFRVGITAKAVVAADRDVYLIYFSGLRKIAIQQDTIYFDYIKELQLTMPLACIEPNDTETLFQAVENQIDTDKVFVTKQRSTAR